MLEGDAAAGSGRGHECGGGIFGGARSRGEIDIVGARTLVGVGNGATLRQAPGTGHGDGAVDAARTGGCGHDHAALRKVEGIRHLRQHAVRLARPRHRGQGAEFATGHVGDAAVQRPVTAPNRQVRDAAPVAPDRASAQFGWGGPFGIGEGRRGHDAQPVESESRGEQVVGAAVFADAHRQFRGGVVRTGDRAAGEECGETEGGGPESGPTVHVAQQRHLVHGQTLASAAMRGIVLSYHVGIAPSC